MSFLERKDNEWLNAAVDREARAQRILVLDSSRLKSAWALGITGVGLPIAIIGQITGRSSGGVGFCLVFFSVLFSFAEIQRELRLLKLVDRMQPSQQLDFEP